MIDDTDESVWLRLALAVGFSTGLRPGSVQPLLEAGRRPKEWLACSDEELRARRVPAAQRRRLSDPRAEDDARRLIDETRRTGSTLLTRDDPRWPAALADLPEAPLVLWARGDAACLDTAAIAVVGTRCPTPYGVHAARGFCEALALAGLTVVSGLARGIDGEAHRTALDCSGTTVAVLGSALDRVYPSEHEELVARIAAEGGCIVSECPPGFRAHPGTFPRRNRILAGLSHGLLVVEAGRRSGALITCDWALCYGRPVWAVPGPYSAPSSAGCHRLIRDGAFLAESPDGLLQELGVAIPETADTAVLSSGLETRILEALRRGPKPVEALATEVQGNAQAIVAALGSLELRGLVEYRAGGSYHARRATT